MVQVIVQLAVYDVTLQGDPPIVTVIPKEVFTRMSGELVIVIEIATKGIAVAGLIAETTGVLSAL